MPGSRGAPGRPGPLGMTGAPGENGEPGSLGFPVGYFVVNVLKGMVDQKGPMQA